MIRPQPSSTLFPYTTLFRSGPAPNIAGVYLLNGRVASRECQDKADLGYVGQAAGLRQDMVRPGLRKDRSEEHTSELQSHSDLVCRLLLEKKKKWIKMRL